MTLKWISKNIKVEHYDHHYCGYAKKDVNYMVDCPYCDIYISCWGAIELDRSGKTMVD